MAGSSMATSRADHEVDISLPGDFNVFISRSILYLWDMKDYKIQFHKAEKVSSFKEFEKYKNHMKHIHKDIFPSPQKPSHTLKSSFADTIQFFNSTQPKKKLLCRIEGNYLVKKYFTEGVQYVDEGEAHSYKVIGRALDIYTSNRILELKSLHAHYDKCTNLERILSGETKIIQPNTYYIIIAPCHTFFKKVIWDVSGVRNSTIISTSNETEVGIQLSNAVEKRNGTPSSEELPSLHESSVELYSSSMHSIDTEGINTSEMVNGRDIRSSERPSKRVKYSTPSTFSMASTSVSPLPLPSASQLVGSSMLPLQNPFRDTTETGQLNESELVYDSDRQTKSKKDNSSLARSLISSVETALVPPSPSVLRDEVERMIAIDNSAKAVFAIRKADSIESYSLRPGSTFRVHADITTGSFVIENDDMDPSIIEYHGDVQYIREIAKFNNGSTFETTLTVQKDLLNELQDPSKKKEKVVVNYFFEFTFKAIESAYEKFKKMRYTKMIGSCVPAIVSMNNAKFCGAVSDTYEAKPY